VTTVAAPAIVHVEHVMGTAVSFHLLPGEADDVEAAAQARAALKRAVALLHHVDEVFSTWKPESEVSRFRAGLLAETELSSEVRDVVELCGRAKALSDGWFDPWAMPGGFDPTGLVKGWAVDRVCDELRRAGVVSAMVNGGGDVALLGDPPGGGRWRVGIRHPWREEALACVLHAEQAVATSGCYERSAHLVDPKGPASAKRAASATVTGTSLAMADALATALAVGGEPVFRLVAALDGFAAYWIHADGTEFATDGIEFA